MLRRLPARRLAALALAAIALAGCSVPSNTPESYDDESVREFFMDGCQGGGTTDDTTRIEVDGTTTTLAGQDACACAFDVFRERVPYDDQAKDDDERFAGYEGPTFLELDDEAGNDPTAARDSIPEDVRAAIEECNSGR